VDTERPRDVTNLGLVFGRAEEGQAWVGRILPERTAVCEVTTSMVIDFCALVEDPNPAYWGGGEAPPGLLMTWTFPPPWQPHTAPGPALAAAAVPLPGRHVINVRTATSFVRQLRLGDRVSWTDEILEVTPPKRTRLGTGHFITTRTSFTDAAGNPVAVNDNVLYRYDVAETQPTLAGAAPASVPEAIPASPELPPVVLPAGVAECAVVSRCRP